MRPVHFCSFVYIIVNFVFTVVNFVNGVVHSCHFCALLVNKVYNVHSCNYTLCLETGLTANGQCVLILTVGHESRILD